MRIDRGGRGCAIVTDYTYTLREACEDCSFDEVQARTREINEAERPLPK